VPRKTHITTLEEYLKDPQVYTDAMMAKLIIPDGFTYDTGVGDRIPCKSNSRVAKLLKTIEECPYCGRKVNVKAIVGYGEMTLTDVEVSNIWRFNCEAGCFITKYYRNPLKDIISYIKRTAIVWLIDEIMLEKAYLKSLKKQRKELE
jgi:hypothetical protein